jgi:hypothetical protein
MLLASREEIMNRSMVVAVSAIVSLCVTSTSFADKKSTDKKKEEYVSTAKATPLLTDALQAFPGKEVQVVEYELSPGWVGNKSEPLMIKAD